MNNSIDKKKPLSFTGFIIPFGIFVLALIIRLVYLTQIKNCPLFDAPIMDALYHDQWARTIANGDWLGKEVFFRAPLYPYLLAVIYKLFGVNYYWPRIIQFVLGSLSCVLIYLITKKVFNRTIGIIAAIIAVFYGTFIYFEGELLLDSLTVFLNLCLLLWLIKTREEPKNWKWLVAGIIVGLSAITRPNILVFAGFILIWFLTIFKKNERFKNFTFASLSFCMGIGLIVFPITLRNYLVGKDLELIAYQGGVNFYIGNNPQSNGWTAIVPGMMGNWCDAIQQIKDDEGRDLMPSEMSLYWYKKGLYFVKNEPVKWLGLMLRKFVLFWGGIEISNNQDIYFFGRKFSSLMRILLWRNWGLSFSFGIFGPLAILGLVLSITNWRKLLLLYGYTFAYMISIIMFFVCSRYRIPSIAVLIIFSAYTLYWWYQKIRGRKFREFMYSFIPFLLLVFILNIDVGGVTKATEAQSYFNLGVGYAAKNKWQQALDAYEKARQIDPCMSDPHNNIGNIYYRNEEYNKAIREFKLAIVCEPTYAKPYFNLANTYHQIGKLGQAIEYYERAIRLDSNYESAYAYCGLAYYKLGKLSEALRNWEKTLEINPQNQIALDGLERLKNLKPR